MFAAEGQPTTVIPHEWANRSAAASEAKELAHLLARSRIQQLRAHDDLRAQPAKWWKERRKDSEGDKEEERLVRMIEQGVEKGWSGVIEEEDDTSEEEDKEEGSDEEDEEENNENSGQCDRHQDCEGSKFCMRAVKGGECQPCRECHSGRDAVDGRCPKHCKKNKKKRREEL